MPTPTDRTRAVWRYCLGTALRTMLACTIVGCATLYGPNFLRRQLAFPAFSYVTVILIVPEATLGQALRGFCYALYGTLQGALPAIFCLRVIGPARFSSTTAAFAVALSTFVVSLPESTHLLTKRIAYGQIVLAYVVAYSQGVQMEPVMHPLHVAASTTIGALASVLALMLPYPRLASHEVRQKCRLFAENVKERLNFFTKAFCAEDNTCAFASLSQTMSMSKAGDELLRSITLNKESMLWEKPWIRFSQPHCPSIGDRLQELEVPLRGMEIALTACSLFPIRAADQDLQDGLLRVKEHINLTLEQAKCHLPYNSPTLPDNRGEVVDKMLYSPQNVFPTQEDLPTLFFLFCFKLLYNESVSNQPNTSTLENTHVPNAEETRNSYKQERFTFRGILSIWPVKVSSKRFMSALKSSLSLGFAVLFGLAFNKENGCWSGLSIAISIEAGRAATFKVTNVRAQGTTLGSIYGVLGCFVFQRFTEVRFISLLPWIIFTSFLRHSQMYGEAGGISAAIGALLILGRKNYGPPSEFAIGRITEAFIGLFCFIMVEILLQPKRAATLAKFQLSESLGTLHECIESISHARKANELDACLAAFKQNHRKLRSHISELCMFIKEAEEEPNFWFLPFHGACYNKLLGSLSKIMDLLLIGSHAIALLAQESKQSGAAWKELQDHIDGDLEIFIKGFASEIRCFSEVTSMKSLDVLEKELKEKNISYDLELGKSPNANGCRLSGAGNDEIEKIISSFLRHSRELIDKIPPVEGEQEINSQMVLCLSTLGFYMSDLMKETKHIEKGVKELVQWENPSSHINLYEISSKIGMIRG